MWLSSTQRQVLMWLADGAVGTHDSGRDGRLDRVVFKSQDGSQVGKCAYQTWRSIVWRGLARWSHPNDPDFRLHLTDAGRSAVESHS